ncbi:hypothetical protein GGR58DRAFT_237792 [Xylaria digitata]|nr:hypothetical protein GGR58DRAFT_237792 [Xylaria digitata]
MTALQHLPNEALVLILRFLGAMDLQSTIRAQSVSRRFRDVIQGAVLRSALGSRANADSKVALGSSGGEINPFLRAKFKGLFNSADCFPEATRFWGETLDGDATLPFRQLPWPSRDAFLRPEASWRGLSPTFGMSPPTRRLDVVKTFESDPRNPVEYFQVELPDSGLSMGLLYDILLCEEALYGSCTGDWKLLFGMGLDSFDFLYRWGCFVIDDDDEPGESEFVCQTPDAAILFVFDIRGSGEVVLDMDEWMPQRLMSSRPKFLPWQGPLVKLEDTEWFES